VAKEQAQAFAMLLDASDELQANCARSVRYAAGIPGDLVETHG